MCDVLGSVVGGAKKKTKKRLGLVPEMSPTTTTTTTTTRAKKKRTKIKKETGTAKRADHSHTLKVAKPFRKTKNFLFLFDFFLPFCFLARKRPKKRNKFATAQMRSTVSIFGCGSSPIVR